MNNDNNNDIVVLIEEFRKLKDDKERSSFLKKQDRKLAGKLFEYLKDNDPELANKIFDQIKEEADSKARFSYAISILESLEEDAIAGFEREEELEIWVEQAGEKIVALEDECKTLFENVAKKTSKIESQTRSLKIANDQNLANASKIKRIGLYKKERDEALFTAWYAQSKCREHVVRACFSQFTLDMEDFIENQTIKAHTEIENSQKISVTTWNAALKKFVGRSDFL